MRLLAPLFALGFLLTALPITIHLFGRDRAARRPFPAARLLAAAQRRLSPHARLEAWLLVALRVLAVAAVAAVLTRPIWERPAALPIMVGERQAAVIVLDDSLSMQRRDGVRTLFSRAKTTADELVRAFPEGSEVAIVATSAGDRDPLPHLERERGRVLEGLRKASPSAMTGATTTALARAAALLGSASAPRRRVYLVSDLQASGFDPTHPRPFEAGDAPDAIGLDVLRIGTSPPPNDAIVAVEVAAASDQGSSRLRALAKVRSDGREAHARTIALYVDGAVVARGLVALPRDGAAEKRFEYAVPKGQEPRWVEAALEPDSADALALDDRRAAPVHGGGGRVVLVDGAPGVSRREDETFYLELALRAARGTSASIEVVHEEQLDRLDLDDVAALFLCNPRPSPALARLVPYVERGGGLFVSLGDNLDASALSTQLEPLLPSAIEGTRDLSGPGGVAGGALRLAPPTPALVRRVPSMSDERARDAWSAARTYRVALLRPIPDGDGNREVLARFEDGTPALEERRVGQGRVVLFSSTVDRGWSDLAIQAVFPALGVELAEYLGAVRAGAAEADLLNVGEPATRALGRVLSELGDRRGTIEILPPTGSRRRLMLDPKKPETAFTVDQPGRYELAMLDGEHPGPRPALTFAAVIDPRESDPRVLADAQRLSTPAPSSDKASRPPAQELWHAIAGLLLVLLLGEALLGLRG